MGAYMLEQRVKMICGAGKAAVTGELIRKMGKKKALLVTDRGITAAGIHRRVAEALERSGVGCVVFDGVVPDPTAENVAEGYDLCRSQGCDVVIGMGGGSPMDTSKAINLLRFNEGPVLRYAQPGTGMKPAPGLVLIPTTSGTGSELSDGLVISSGGIKHPILAPDAGAEYAVIDPELMVGIPPRLTAATGLDAMSHAIEGYTSVSADASTDMVNEALIQNIFRWLPVAVKDGGCLEAREQMAVSASMAGWMLQYSHTNAGHSVAHILGSFYHIPHGEACAFATPWVLEFNALGMPQRVRRIAQILGAEFTGEESPEQIGRKAREAFLNFRDKELGQLDIGKYTFDKGSLERAAEAVSGELFQAFNPRRMGKKEAREILEKIFQEREK